MGLSNLQFFGGLVTVLLAMLGVVIPLAVYQGNRIDGLGARIDGLGNRLDARIDGLGERLDHLSGRIDDLGERLGELRADFSIHAGGGVGSSHRER